MKDGLKDAHRDAIIAEIAANDRVERAVLFGSRATGTNTVSSDVDIALFGCRLTLTDQARLAAALDEIPMAQSVDLVLYRSIRNRTLREHVLRQGIELFVRREVKRSKPGTLPSVAADDVVRSSRHLDDVAEITMGQSPRGETVSSREGVALLNGPTEFGTYHPRPVQFTTDPRRFAQSGDLLFCVRGSTTGRMNWADRPYAIGRGVAAIRHRRDLGLQPFVRALIEFELPQLLAQATGSTFPNVSRKQLALIPCPNFNEDEQRAIAHILGTLDDKIELNRQMSQTLEAMARALFKSWFVDFDPVRAKAEGRGTGLPEAITDLFPDRLVASEMGEMPEGWTMAPLGELIDVNPKRRLQRGEIVPYLPMANMPTQGHVPSSVNLRPFGSGMRFANGDTLVARITPCLENGKTAYVDFLRDHEVGWGSTEYIVLKPKPPLPDQFAYCLARSARFREFAIQNMSGTSGRQRVPATAVKGHLMIAPPERLAAEFGACAKSLFDRASRASREADTLVALRDTLLPKLISGEIRVPEAARALAPVT